MKDTVNLLRGRKHRHSCTRAHPSLVDGLSGGTNLLVLQPAGLSVRQGDRQPLRVDGNCTR